MLKKGVLDFETIKVTTILVSSTMIGMKEDLSAFTISCTIWGHMFGIALCYLCQVLILFNFSCYVSIIWVLRRLLLLMADCSIKKLVAVLCDVLVKTNLFIFLEEFFKLDGEIDHEVSIVLGTLFMDTNRDLCFIKHGEIEF